MLPEQLPSKLAWTAIKIPTGRVRPPEVVVLRYETTRIGFTRGWKPALVESLAVSCPGDLSFTEQSFNKIVGGARSVNTCISGGVGARKNCASFCSSGLTQTATRFIIGKARLASLRWWDLFIAIRIGLARGWKPGCFLFLGAYTGLSSRGLDVPVWVFGENSDHLGTTQEREKERVCYLYYLCSLLCL